MRGAPRRRAARRSAVPFGTAFFCATIIAAIAAGSARGDSSAPPPVAPGAAPVLTVPARNADYATRLEYAIALMEAGQHSDARDALLLALILDRNDPTGQLALGVLYLHTGSATRATEVFARLRDTNTDDPLARAGAALADALAGRLDNARVQLAALDPKDVPFAPDAVRAIRIASGDAAAVARQTAAVDTKERDPLALACAGFAALSGGETIRGARLLDALRSRPELYPLIEPGALTARFEPGAPFAGGAPSLQKAIVFPQAIGTALTGRATLALESIPDSTAYVEYTVDGANFHAITNVAPFAAEWNTVRVPNGLYTLRAAASDSNHRVLYEVARSVRVGNSGSISPDRLTAAQKANLRARLLTLLAPQPSRKAVHHALAAYAASVGDSENARARIESVVAIDPSYKGAFLSLKAFNNRYVPAGRGYWVGSTREKLVALTFDDGPNPLPHRTPALLDALHSLDISATFFVVGVRADAAPDLLRRMIADGHEIANHSWSHPNLTYLAPDDVRRELVRTSVRVREITGTRPRFYRPPGGNYNGATAEAAGALGMDGAYWTVDGFKFETKPFSPDDLSRYVLAHVRPGAIVLLHNAFDNTIASLPDIVAGLRERGYTIVTMSELARRSEPEKPAQAKPAPAKPTAKSTTKPVAIKLTRPND